MERYRVDDEYALQFMTRVSLKGDVTLREVAQDLVNTANRKSRGEGHD